MPAVGGSARMKALMPHFSTILLTACGLLLFSGCASGPTGGPADREQALRHFTRGREAYRAERYAEALESFRSALSYGSEDSDTLSVIGELLYLREEYSAAIGYFDRALAGADAAGRREVHSWLACCYFAQHRYERVISHCRKVLASDPGNLIAWHKLAASLRELGQDKSGASACLRGLSRYPDASLELRKQHAYFLGRLGKPVAAERAYQQILSKTGWLAGEEDVRRLGLVQLGRYQQALAAWRGKGTSWVVARPGNRLAERFLTIERAARQPDAHAEIAQAFERVGWLAEAEAAYRRAGGKRRELRRVGAIRQLIAAMRKLLYAGYREYSASEGSRSLERTLQRIEALGQAAGLGPLNNAEEISTVSFLYRYVDPGFDSESRLVRFFRDNGMLLLLFDFFGPVECNLKNLLYWNPRARRQLWGQWVDYELMICERSRIQHYREYQVHSSFGGLTLSPQSFWLDVETYARIAHQLVGGFRRLEQSDRPLSQSRRGSTSPLEIRDAGALKDRLAYVITRQAADALPAGDRLTQDRQRAVLLTQWLLDAAEYHELGHIQLQRNYLPVSAHLFRGIGLLFQEGFSAQNISAWSERQAQLTALVHARQPLVALYRTVSSIGKSAERSRHAKAYRGILSGFVGLIHAQPSRFPNIDVRRNILAQLHRLTADQVRELAQELY